MKVKLVPVCDCVREYNKDATKRKLVWGDITFIKHDHDDSDDPSTGITVDFYFMCSVCKKRWREEIVAL